MKYIREKLYVFRFAKDNVLRFLVGNKTDLRDKRKVSEQEGKELGIFTIN